MVRDDSQPMRPRDSSSSPAANSGGSPSGGGVSSAAAISQDTLFDDSSDDHARGGGPAPSVNAHPASLSTLSAGSRIGPYSIERSLGAGGMGLVVAARHVERGDVVAIKVLHPKAAEDRIQVERFVREARSTARLKSEHVVRVLDAGADAATGAPYIVMEYLVGSDLGRVLQDHGPVAVHTAVAYLLQICDAVAEAHALGIVHRDLKPSNFFVSQRPDGTAHVKVLDFGISKAQPDGMGDMKLTETQAVFGSPTYMSPEQIRSSKHVDYRSDVWSLGVALFELLTGRLPFIADNMAGLLASIIADPPAHARAFAPAVPPQLEQVIFGCLEKDPSRRIGSVAELAARLAPFATPDARALAERVAMKAGRSLLTAPLAPLGRPPELSSSPVFAYGSTGTDLGTNPSVERARRNSLIAIIAVAFVVMITTSGIGIAYVTRTRAMASASSSAAAPPVSSSLSALPAASVSASATTATAASVSAVPLVADSAGAHPVPRTPSQTTTTHGVVAPISPAVSPSSRPRNDPAVRPPTPTPTPATPSPAPSPNLDSRY